MGTLLEELCIGVEPSLIKEVTRLVLVGKCEGFEEMIEALNALKE